KITPEAQALFCRRRHQPRRPLPAKIRTCTKSVLAHGIASTLVSSRPHAEMARQKAEKTAFTGRRSANRKCENPGHYPAGCATSAPPICVGAAKIEIETAGNACTCYKSDILCSLAR